MKKRFFWIDLEMTGLDDSADHIVEIAAVITDIDFKPLEEFHRIVYQPSDVLEKMGDFVRKLHTTSGLIDQIPGGIPLQKAEQDLLQFVDRHFSPSEKIPLSGNSVGNDKRFIDRHMPLLAQRLHYRIIDVSSFKEIFREKYHVNFQKKNAHRAVSDIYESIEELKYYLSFVQMKPGTPAVSKSSET